MAIPYLRIITITSSKLAQEMNLEIKRRMHHHRYPHKFLLKRQTPKHLRTEWICVVVVNLYMLLHHCHITIDVFVMAHRSDAQYNIHT